MKAIRLMMVIICCNIVTLLSCSNYVEGSGANLIRKLHSENASDRADAAKQVVLREDASIFLPYLLNMAKDTDPKVRAASIFALARIAPDSAEVRNIIANAIFDESEAVGDELTSETIGIINPDKAIIEPAIIKALNFNKAEIRFRGVLIVSQFIKSGKTVSPEMISQLVKATDDQEAPLRITAIKTIVDLDLGPVIVDGLIDKLKDDSPEVVKMAINGLAKYPEESRKALPMIFDLLLTGDKSVRIEAIRVLNNYGTDAKGAVSNLVKLLKDDNWEIRSEAANNIGFILKNEIDDKTLDLLISMLSDDNAKVRLNVIRGLEYIGNRAQKALPKLIYLADNDVDEKVQIEAKSAIVHISQ